MKSPEVSPPASPPRPYRGESAEDRREQRKVRLMDAAFESFARHGIAKTTMRDICSQARLTDRYFYESFRNTEDAFDAVYQWQREQLITRIAQAMQNEPLRNIEDLAKAGLRAFYAFILEDRRHAQVLLIDAFHANQQSREEAQRALEQYVTLISEVAHSLFPRLKTGFNMEMLVWGLLGMAIQVGTIWARGNYQQSVEEVMDYNLFAWRGLQAWSDELVAQAMTRKPATRKSTGKSVAGKSTSRKSHAADARPARQRMAAKVAG